MVSIFGVVQYNHYTDLRSDYLNIVKRISQRLSGKFDFYYHNVQNISLNTSVKKLNAKESSDYFDSLVGLYPSYDLIILTDTSGKLVAANRVGSQGESLKWKISYDLSGTKWFSSLVQSEKSEDYSKKLFGSLSMDVEKSEAASLIYKRNKRGMHFSTPVRDKKEKIVGYITTFVNHKWLAKLLKSASKEILRSKDAKFDAVLVNAKNEVLASNTNLKDSKIPFEVQTAQFSKSWKEGRVMDGIRSLKVFFTSPFFIVSKFNHQNFINDFDWSLVARFGKERAFTSIWNNSLLALFAVSLFAIGGFIYRGRVQAMFRSEVAHAWKSAEKSFSRPEKVKKATRALKSVYRSLDGLRGSELLDLASPPSKLELVDSAKRECIQNELVKSFAKQEKLINSMASKNANKQFKLAISSLGQREEEVTKLKASMNKLDTTISKLKEKCIELDIKPKEYRQLDTLLEEVRGIRRKAVVCCNSLGSGVSNHIDHIRELWNTHHSSLDELKASVAKELSSSEQSWKKLQELNNESASSQESWWRRWSSFNQNFELSKASIEEFKFEIEKTQELIKKLGMELSTDKNDSLDDSSKKRKGRLKKVA
tara:strand:+ start:51735 stop:53519 length:1785 start_codon:yes stop_codon:yes gene_type:complete